MFLRPAYARGWAPDVGSRRLQFENHFLDRTGHPACPRPPRPHLVDVALEALTSGRRRTGRRGQDGARCRRGGRGCRAGRRRARRAGRQRRQRADGRTTRARGDGVVMRRISSPPARVRDQLTALPCRGVVTHVVNRWRNDSSGLRRGRIPAPRRHDGHRPPPLRGAVPRTARGTSRSGGPAPPVR